MANVGWAGIEVPEPGSREVVAEDGDAMELWDEVGDQSLFGVGLAGWMYLELMHWALERRIHTYAPLTRKE